MHDTTARPRMGTALRPRALQSGTRPSACPRRRSTQYGRGRLGAGRRAEEWRSGRGVSPNRDQDSAYRPALGSRLPRRRNAMLSPHRPWRGEGARHAHALADRYGGQRSYPFRYGRQLRHGHPCRRKRSSGQKRSWSRLLAPLPRTQPGWHARRSCSRCAKRGRANITPSSRPAAGRANHKRGRRFSCAGRAWCTS